MQAFVIEAPEQAHMAEVAVPGPTPDEVQIEVVTCGACGTDLHIYHGEYTARYPLIPGHEFSGVVSAVGEQVVNFRPGDRVTVDPNVSCNRCPACLRGQFSQCQNMRSVGGNSNGGFARYTVVPECNVFPIGDIPFERAAFVEPLACVVWGLKRAQIQPGDNVLIFGSGPTGCLLQQAIRLSGAARVIVTERDPWRLQQAAELGAADEIVLADEHAAGRLRSLAPNGYDVVVDATGNPEVYGSVFDLVRPYGKVWVFGVCSPNARVAISPFQVFRSELTIVGSHAASRTFQESIALLKNGRVQVDRLVSHRLPLDSTREALRIAESGTERMKVQVTVSQ